MTCSDITFLQLNFDLPCDQWQTRCVGKRAAVFGPGRGCSGLAVTTPGDVIFGSIVEDVLPPVW